MCKDAQPPNRLRGTSLPWKQADGSETNHQQPQNLPKPQTSPNLRNLETGMAQIWVEAGTQPRTSYSQNGGKELWRGGAIKAKRG